MYLFLSATNKTMVDQASSGLLRISQLLGGSPSKDIVANYDYYLFQLNAVLSNLLFIKES